MQRSSVFFVGTQAEMQHHAAPLLERATEIDADLHITTADEALQQSRPGDLAIFFSEHFDRFRQTCVELKEKRVATLYMVDGILEWRNAWENRADEPACPWTMRPVLADKVAVIGNSQARMLNEWGNQSKIEVVGIPRLDCLLATTPRIKTGHQPIRVLVATAKTPGFTEQQIANTTRALLDLKTWGESNPDVDFIWRLTEDLDRKIQVENTTNDLTGKELAATLLEVDAVITSPSTLILEAMLVGLPVATFDYSNCPQYVPAAWHISASSQIDQVIKEIVDPASVKMQHQQSILRDALGNAFADENATERFVALINGMLRESRQQISRFSARENGKPAKVESESKTLVFSPAILPPTQPSELIFDHATLFAEHSAFNLDDRAELRSQLAHARREIEHLHSQQDALRTELAQAHEIFDQIESHPIAGPVVRFRKRILTMIQAFRSPRKPNAAPPAISSPESTQPVSK